ncbi:MAG: T9SS type A sorting domain-containing protein, partial [Bacteroidota bacterium]
PVRVAIYDALGREVAVVQDGAMAAGAHDVALPLARLSQGTYLVRIEAGTLAETRRLTVVR